MLNGTVRLIYHCGDVSDEVPPVLIPNTEVKLISAENTLSETIRENRSLLHPKKTTRTIRVVFSCYVNLVKKAARPFSREPLMLFDTGKCRSLFVRCVNEMLAERDGFKAENYAQKLKKSHNMRLFKQKTVV